jgi:hypothetical protein
LSRFGAFLGRRVQKSIKKTQRPFTKKAMSKVFYFSKQIDKKNSASVYSISFGLLRFGVFFGKVSSPHPLSPLSPARPNVGKKCEKNLMSISLEFCFNLESEGGDSR